MIVHPLKVRELLDEVARGEVVLPEFQRAYVWKPLQVVRLLDSLYRGYPAGQVLLWDTAELPATTRGLEGVAETGFQPAGRPKVVLDGQQRLTSLYKALAPGARDPVDVRFDLRTEQFALRRRRMDASPYWVDVRAVLAGQRHDLEVLRAIAAAGGPSLDDPACATYLERLQGLRRLAEFRFPIEVFRSDDLEQVTELFVRINSGGTRLRQAELVLAQLTLHLPGVVAGRFEAALERYEAQGYALDARLLVRALVALGTGQSRFGALDALWRRPPAELEALWERTREALDRAIEFARVRARFESAEWLPSLNGLVPLAALLDRRPELSRDDEVGLLRWFWLAQLRARYSAGAEAALDEDLRAVAAERPVVELLSRVLAAAPSAAVEPDELDQADWRNPVFPMTYAVACRRGARDWFTGAPLAARPRGEVVVHPIFPRGLLEEAGHGARRHDEAANLVFLSERPGVQATLPPDAYLPDVLASDPRRLEDQSVPLDPALWRLERYDDFLAARRALLAGAINGLLDDPL
ncbi:MAG: DUF262 domain-containing protein [Planctomycetes bacterium]|nr:DUF262 domain-containing protein [Planctomycetota bacterium]